MIKQTIFEKELPPIFLKGVGIRQRGSVVMIYALVTAILVGSIAVFYCKD